MKKTNKKSRKVSVLGLGQMGRKISQLYIDAGYEVTAWNRTQRKANELEKVQFVETPEQAVLASPLIVLIITDNKGTFEILEGLSDTQIFKDKTLVNFTMGSPAEAESIETIVSDAEGNYINGAIQVGPNQLGLKSATIFSSGNREALDRYFDDLTIIGGNIRHLSDKAVASAAMDTATSTWMYGAFLGLLYGAELIQHYGLALEDYSNIIGEITADFTTLFKHELEVIDRDDFQVTQSSLAISVPATQRLVDSYKELNVMQEFPTIIRDILAEAERKGLGDEELAAISKIIAKRT